MAAKACKRRGVPGEFKAVRVLGFQEVSNSQTEGVPGLLKLSVGRDFQGF